MPTATQRTIVETSPGRFMDPDTKKRTSKQDGDKVVSKAEFEKAQGKAKAETKATDKPKTQDRKPVELSTGVMTTDEVITIKCKNASKKSKPDACVGERVIKKQDKFQVKFCVPCQKENRNELRRNRRAAQAKAKK